jgi:hypothetical protein
MSIKPENRFVLEGHTTSTDYRHPCAFEDPGELPNIDAVADVMAIWYYAPYYDGHGMVVYRDERTQQWYYSEIAHCSCYGPDEGHDFPGKGPYPTVAQMNLTGDDALLEQLLRSHGYEGDL